MKILALSDSVVDQIYSAWVLERFSDVDLIVGCGDLPADYLEYVVTQLNVPLVYVPGNHDPDDYRVPGGISIDGRVEVINGVRIAGLGGSQRYKSRGRHQYTEQQMFYRMVRTPAHSPGAHPRPGHSGDARPAARCARRRGPHASGL